LAHFVLYSLALASGSSISKNGWSQTRSTDSYAAILFKILDMLKVLGIKTFLWFDALAKKLEKPKGVSISRLTKTGLAV
jgi:hypothetical protein